MTRFRPSHLREQIFKIFKNSIKIFSTVLILIVVAVWISNQRLTFFSTVPYLMIKESLF